ncbi:hypothetical protein KSS87_018349 [Heliosperma pusillum]|nr:hypothetical protein KSS87_018349 [Heliosperma pusillum]
MWNYVYKYYCPIFRSLLPPKILMYSILLYISQRLSHTEYNFGKCGELILMACGSITLKSQIT